MRQRRVPLQRAHAENVPKTSWFERNQGLIQFLLLLCTIAAIWITFHFSNKNLEGSNKNLAIAAQQVTQNRQVFNYTKTLDSLRDKNELEKDSFQKLLNEKQLMLNTQQNRFIAGQLENQLLQVQRQNEIEKPNLSLFSLENEFYDTLNRVANATVKNTSKRTAHIIKVVSAVCYKNKLLTIQNTSNNFDIPEAGTYSSAFLLKEELIQDSSTLYYLKFFYKDLNKQVKAKEFYFSNYGYSWPKTYFLPVSVVMIRDFQNFVRQRVDNYEQLFNDPYYKEQRKLRASKVTPKL